MGERAGIWTRSFLTDSQTVRQCQKFKMQAFVFLKKDFFSFPLLSKRSSVLLFLFKDQKRKKKKATEERVVFF